MEEKDAKGSEVLSWIRVIVIAVALALLIDNVFIINATVPSGSMENTIATHSRVLGLRTVYWNGSPQRGDIVVFKYPVAKALSKETRKDYHLHSIYVKRVIGLPGETVTIRDGKIYIDGSDTPLEEDYLPEEWTEMNTDQTYHVPDGCYFMLGDNRNNSADSRYWADDALEYGAAATQKEAEQFRYVPKSDIEGKVYFCYWPLGKIGGLY